MARFEVQVDDVEHRRAVYLTLGTTPNLQFESGKVHPIVICSDDLGATLQDELKNKARFVRA